MDELKEYIKTCPHIPDHAKRALYEKIDQVTGGTQGTQSQAPVVEAHRGGRKGR